MSTDRSRPTSEAGEDDEDASKFALYGVPAPLRQTRSSTSTPTHRRGSGFVKAMSDSPDPGERLKKAMLEGTTAYRLSLESISETRIRRSLEKAPLYPSLEQASDSPTSCDFALKTESMEQDQDKTYASSTSSYISWMDSANSEYFASCSNNAEHELGNKATPGEWNNFWRNYNNTSSSNEYFSSPYICKTDSEENVSTCGSNRSTQRELITERTASSDIVLSAEEVAEAAKCIRKLSEILNGAIRRSEMEAPPQNDASTTKTLAGDANKDTSNTNENEAEDSQKVSAAISNKCIEAIFSHTGVADIIKRVMSKKKEFYDDRVATRRSSTPEWSSFISSKK